MRPPDDTAEQDRLNRFWDDLVRDADPRGRQDDASLDPALAAKVRRFHGIDDERAPTPAFRRGLRQELFGSQALAIDAPFTPVDWPGTTPDSFTPSGRITVDVPRSRQPRRWWPPLEFAAAVLLIVGLFGLYFGGYRALPLLLGERGEPRRVVPERLFDVAIPRDLIDTSLYNAEWRRLTFAPGATATRDGLPRDVGFAVEHVVEGSYAVRSDGPLTVLRGSSAPPEEVPPGTEVLLGPGDTVVYLYSAGGVGGEARNAGTDPVVLISIARTNYNPAGSVGIHTHWGELADTGPITAIELPSIIADPVLATMDAMGTPAGAPARASLGLWRVALPAGEALAPVRPGGVQVVTGVSGASPPLRYGTDGQITNAGDAPADLLVVTVNPEEAPP